ncbi:ABC-F family ATP-binding cassette domain-containing protein [Calidifontibacter sp. DB0510]|uniref:ABC-F family ATP-binding cassette domain-containing protein n=1 Tax=Metallococcus carri TaxID=1656884 RepID=A0A967B1I6_9MICO|nr:ATP-binding cassette domain-containing protein [Metallococcus carri]NHN56317.1 ABC-F family ATP-binding cassette domain-containing protein [Metallococcus carri]NOP38631.1 ABC-F family ATP-binding cassette domain-containing protein [Calidifontibacter sp. DB2511S]
MSAISPAALVLRDVHRTFRDRVVLDGIELTAPPGQRVGLVGENGSGKSTLLRIAAGLDVPDGGEVHRPADLGYLAQDTGLGTRHTVGRVLRDALAPLHAMVTEVERAADALPTDAAAYDRALEDATSHDAWDADRRAQEAAARLGLEQIDPSTRVGELSGGQRARLALAALLTRRPACLLLDEPTNHVDDDGLDFLESQLLSMPGVVLIATHDRVLLDRVCTTIVDLDPSHFGSDGDGGRVFTGSYAAYVRAKEQARTQWLEAFIAQREELEELRKAARTTNLDIAHDRGPRDGDKYIYGFKGSRVQATVSRRRRNAEQRIAAVERELIPKPPVPLRFRGAIAGAAGASATVRDLFVEGRVAVDRLDIATGDKLLLTGPNGSGKSSLLAVLAGRLAPDRGRLDVHVRRVGLLPQQVTFTDPRALPVDLYAATDPPVPLRELGLLHPRDLRSAVGELSVGQQHRLALALLLAEQADLLLLDEPTNHLSPALVEELEAAVRETTVTVVIASHDRWLRARWEGSAYRL